jgi:hypothetical protein
MIDEIGPITPNSAIGQQGPMQMTETNSANS